MFFLMCTVGVLYVASGGGGKGCGSQSPVQTFTCGHKKISLLCSDCCYFIFQM